METTRHFTASVHVVHGGETLLHDHKRLDLWLPPGGHLDRDELPHEAAVREAREETGLALELVAGREEIRSETVRQLPRPRHVQLADINVHDGEVGHQHVDFVYYARAAERGVDPEDGEVTADRWEWFGPNELDDDDRIPVDVAEIGRRAIETV
ncbi:MAG: NUDIX domain-containing protein [Halobacteriales archaeon]